MMAPARTDQPATDAALATAAGAPPPAQTRSKHGMGDIAILATVLIALAVLGGVIALAVRRRVLARDQAASRAGLAEGLRDMHNRGILSTEEYDRIRRSMARAVADEVKNDAAKRARPPSKSG